MIGNFLQGSFRPRTQRDAPLRSKISVTYAHAVWSERTLMCDYVIIIFAQGISDTEGEEK